MASHKLVTIIGIHARETFLNVSDAEAVKVWKQTASNPDFVAGALFKGGHIAPLSGQEYRLIKVKARRAIRSKL